jgi:hypothetical protein
VVSVKVEKKLKTPKKGLGVLCGVGAKMVK